MVETLVVQCSQCDSTRVYHDDQRYTPIGSIQHFLCWKCGNRLSDGNSNKSYQTKVNRQVCVLTKARNLALETVLSHE